MVISGLPGLCESPEIPQGASPGSSHEWGGLELFPRFRFVPTNTNVQKAGWEGDVREGSMAPEQSPGTSSSRDRAGDRDEVLGQALLLCLKLHPDFLPEKGASSLRKQIWEGNEKGKMWLLQHKVGDTIL